MISESTSLTQEVSLERSGLAIRDEEPINATTHGLGCLISACGMFWMIAAYAGESPASLVVSLLFTSLLTLTYGVSALSHAVSATREKRLLRAWDQGVIYLLIVATYTPFLWKYVPSPILEITLGVVWIAAMAGFVSKVVLLRRIDEDFSPYSYIALDSGVDGLLLRALGLSAMDCPGRRDLQRGCLLSAAGQSCALFSHRVAPVSHCGQRMPLFRGLHIRPRLDGNANR